jgi:hypothetical protein
VSSGEVDRMLRTLWGLSRGARHRRRIAEELADHLREATADERARGLSGDAAERRAVERFGDPSVVARAFPVSRWRRPAAMLALTGTGALVWADVATHQASLRTCVGGRCPAWLPRAPQHPIRERVEAVTAAAAVILAIGFAVSAAWRRHQASRAYQAALSGDAQPASSITTTQLLRDAVRWPTRVAAVSLALAVVAGAGLAMRWQTEGPPSTGVRVLPLRPAVLKHHPGMLTGTRRARPLLRRILTRMPSDFISVGIHPGKGLVIRQPGWANADPHTTDPNILLERFEITVLEESFAGLQGHDSGRHVGKFDAGSISGDLRAPGVISPPSTANLGRRIASRLDRLGLHVKSLHITYPYGPLAIAVVQTTDPKAYIARPAAPLSHRIRWGAFIIEDTTGAVRFVSTTEPGRRQAETWFDPRLFPAQPYVGGPVPPRAPQFRPAPRTRTTRT